MAGLNVNTIADEAGTGGPDFVAMPSVGGSPIVESGSNSDGEWWRSADGTQMCASPSLITSNTGDSVWTFPVPFTVSPTSKVGSARTGQSNVNAYCRATGNETFTDYAGFFADTGARVDAGFTANAIGRWK